MDEKFIREVLQNIIDPKTGDAINARVKSISIISSNSIAFTIECNKSDIEAYKALAAQCVNKFSEHGVEAKISFTNSTHQHQEKESKKRTVPNVGKILLVASGKGGVGKSTIAFNLALSLAKQGAKVGIVDADIYGPSLPKLSGLSNKPALDSNNLMIPHSKFDIKMMSVGYLVDEENALIWRGPMTTKILHQLIMMTNWAHDDKPLDYLVIDTPPGTGDVHLSLAENFYIDAALIVSAPQELSTADAMKSMQMYQKLDIPISGIIRNYAFFTDSNGKRNYLFGDGVSIDKIAKKFKVPVIAEIPVVPEISSSSDSGKPFVYYNEDHEVSKIFDHIASSV